MLRHLLLVEANGVKTLHFHFGHQESRSESIGKSLVFKVPIEAPSSR